MWKNSYLLSNPAITTHPGQLLMQKDQIKANNGEKIEISVFIYFICHIGDE